MEDIFEYIQEIFEIDNSTTRKLLCNALLHYFYIPVIVGSLTGKSSSDKSYQISVNTALFVLNKTFGIIEFQPFINAICIALLAKEGPSRIICPKFSCKLDPA